MVILIIVMKELLVWHGGRDTQAIDIIDFFLISGRIMNTLTQVLMKVEELLRAWSSTSATNSIQSSTPTSIHTVTATIATTSMPKTTITSVIPTCDVNNIFRYIVRVYVC